MAAFLIVIWLKAYVLGINCTLKYCIEVRNIMDVILYTRAVRKVSGHFEYLENRTHGPDVTWQQVRGDITVHP